MNLKKTVERLKSEKEEAEQEEAVTFERGELAAYVHELLGKAERGELPDVEITPEKEKSEARSELDAYVARIADRTLRYKGNPKFAPVKRSECADANREEISAGEADEPPEALLELLMRKMDSHRVH